MRGITDEVHAAETELVGDADGELCLVPVQDPYRQVGDADTGANLLDGALSGEIDGTFAVLGMVLDGEGVATRMVRGHERTVTTVQSGILQVVQGDGAVVDELGQVSLEDPDQIVAEGSSPVRADAQGRSDGAAVSVRSYQVVSADGLDLPLLAAEGLDAVSMRRVAQALGTGAASLYAHLRDKEELYELMLDQLIGEVIVPESEPRRWREQLKDLMRSMIRVMIDHPGSAQLAIAITVPTGTNALRVMEGMLAILRAGGLPDRVAAFAGDLIATYVSAFALEADTWAGAAADATAVAERTQQIRDYFAALPPDRFSHVVALAGPLTEGSIEERFEFGLEVLVSGLERISATN